MASFSFLDLSKISLTFEVEYQYESFCRDAHFTVPTFDFFFKVVLPKANKERLIMERDYLGRILSSKVPDSPILYA